MQYSVDESKELKTTLTKEKFEELKELVLKDVSLDRQKLVWKFPFTGGIAMKMDIVPVRDVRVRTACTDGRRIYVDMAFYAKLDERDRTFVIAHEIWHVVMMHMLRRQTREHDLFNIATDKEINYILSKEGMPCPDFCLFPTDKEENLSAEEIYERLLKKAKKQSKKSSKKQSKDGSNGVNGGGDADDSDDGDDSRGKGRSGSDERECRSYQNNGYRSDNKELAGQFDKHVYGDDENGKDGKDGSEGNDGNNGESADGGASGITDQWGEVGFDSDFHPTIDRDLADRIRESIVETAQSIRRSGRGTVPASISAYIDSICKPEISWKELLSQFVTSCYGGQRQWLPVNRRHVHSGIYLQSRRDERIKVTVAIDTSGSCTADAPKFLGELMSLLRSFGDYEVNVIQCDAAVSSCERYDGSNPFDFDCRKFQFQGGGGTSFTPVFEYVRDNAIETDCLIYFTDGYGDVMEQPPPYPTMWLVTKDGHTDFCEWGTKVRFKRDS